LAIVDDNEYVVKKTKIDTYCNHLYSVALCNNVIYVIDLLFSSIVGRYDITSNGFKLFRDAKHSGHLIHYLFFQRAMYDKYANSSDIFLPYMNPNINPIDCGEEMLLAGFKDYGSYHFVFFDKLLREPVLLQYDIVKGRIKDDLVVKKLDNDLYLSVSCGGKVEPLTPYFKVCAAELIQFFMDKGLNNALNNIRSREDQLENSLKGHLVNYFTDLIKKSNENKIMVANRKSSVLKKKCMLFVILIWINPPFL